MPGLRATAISSSAIDETSQIASQTASASDGAGTLPANQFPSAVASSSTLTASPLRQDTTSSRPQLFSLFSFFLQFARNRMRSWPCNPLASACFEHSIPSGVCGGAGLAFRVAGGAGPEEAGGGPAV